MQERAMTASSSGKGDERIIRAKESLGLSPAPQGLSIHCFCLFGKNMARWQKSSNWEIGT